MTVVDGIYHINNYIKQEDIKTSDKLIIQRAMSS